MEEQERLGEEVHRYAEGVAEGEIVAGPGVRSACRRHLLDLDEGTWTFDAFRAGFAIGFFDRFLRHYKGAKWAGKPFRLEPFQRFIVGSLFGWIGDDGWRRFRRCYVETGKGNGKSPLAAGICLLGLVADDEPGAEIYPAATTRFQAGIVFNNARTMALKSPAMRERLRILTHTLEHQPSQSFMHAVSSEAGNLHGPIPHVVALDELHAAKTGEVIDTLSAGTKSRTQPIILEITNSGADQTSVCWEHHQTSLHVADPNKVEEDDRWFGFVCGLDPEDELAENWKDRAVWPKANPGIGTILPYDYVEGEIRQAENIPSKLGRTKRLNLCIWVNKLSDDVWIGLDKWMAGRLEISIESLLGRECYGAVDLSSTTDLACFGLCFPPTEGDQHYVWLEWYWVARSDVWQKRYSRGIPYHAWLEQGWLTECPRPTIDQDMIEAKVLEAAQMFDLRELAVDKWEAAKLISNCQEEGIIAYPHAQDYQHMDPPLKETERLILEGHFVHRGNPVSKWNMQNAVITEDSNGNRKINKKRSRDRVDGAVTMVMATGRAVVRAEPEEEFEYGAA